MIENEESDVEDKVVRAFVYQSGESAELKFGTLAEILGGYESCGVAFVVVRPGRPDGPRNLDFFVTVAEVGERAAQGFGIGVGAAGQLVVTLDDNSPVIVYAPTAWLEYKPG